MKRGDCGCGNPAPQHNATTGRVEVDPASLTPPTPMGQTRAFDRNYDVQAYTGYPTSKVAAGQWNRGLLYRQAMPALRLSGLGRVMYDTTDPATWLPNP